MFFTLEPLRDYRGNPGAAVTFVNPLTRRAILESDLKLIPIEMKLIPFDPPKLLVHIKGRLIRAS